MDRSPSLDATGLPLVATKLHPPRRRRTTVPRPRLGHSWSAGTEPALTLVSAPAGFGKTTFVTDRVAGSTTAWLSLEPADDDVVRFWTYVVASIDAAVPGLGRDATLLLQEPGISIEVVVATLINDVEATAVELTLVLDDYHVIGATAIHESVAFLVDHLPVPMHLVIATRADPPLPLASLRATGDLVEVRAADLRFTGDEAAAYLNGTMGLTLSAADIEVLETRTEGWIAALQLAALSLQGREDTSSFVAEFAGDDRFILDYLADEVLEHQRPEIRDFLLETSILGRLSGPLCAAVTGVVDAGEVLEELHRTNLFIVALDDRRTWYRYHHLFGDVLRARLIDGDPSRVAALHRRAGDWYAANGDPQDAVAHALASGDQVRAAELIERVAPEMHRARQESTLRAWIEALPAETFVDRPVLEMYRVGSRMATGDPTQVEPLLEQIQAELDGGGPLTVIDEDEFARIPAMIAVYRAGLALLAGDVEATVRHAEGALALVGASDPLQRGAAAALLGLAHWNRGALEPAAGRYAESIACFESGHYLPDVMGCSLALTDIQITQGRLDDAHRTFESALRHGSDHPGLRGLADMHAGLSLLATGHNDLEAAAEHLRRCTELGEAMGLPQHPYRWRVAAARLQEARGDLDAALDLLREAEAVYNTDFSPRVRPVTAMTARVNVALGNVDAGLRWAATEGLGPDDDLTYLREFEHITLARVLLARGTTTSLEQSTRLLDRLLDAADAGGRWGNSIEILVVQALAHHASGREQDALTALVEALERADGEGDVRVFLDAGAAMIPMLGSLDGAAGQRATRVLEGDGARLTGDRPGRSGPDEPSERELEVLHLLRGDLSGPEIARELHVSLNTFRTHTKHIYTKLGVTNRRQAVRRAAELGL